MKRGADGAFSLEVDHQVGSEYQFRYLADGCHWGNDKDADKQVPSPFGDS
jgi:hypothetical protein